MIIGFTGTQRGMTEAQRVGVYRLLAEASGELHHGDCIGADADAHLIARATRQYRIVLHPPIITTKRAWCEADEVRPALPYLERNKAIVTESEIMIATPGEYVEQLRSGTWSTVRAAKRIGRHAVLVMPGGELLVRPR